jgi:hypothetical protein
MSNDIKNIISRVGGLRVIDYVYNKYILNDNSYRMVGGNNYKRDDTAPPFIYEDKEIDSIVHKYGISPVYKVTKEQLTNSMNRKGAKLEDGVNTNLDKLIESAEDIELELGDRLYEIRKLKDGMIVGRKIYQLEHTLEDNQKLDAEKDMKKKIEMLGEDYLKDISNKIDKKLPEEEKKKLMNKYFKQLYTDAIYLLHNGLLELYDHDTYPPFISEDDIISGKVYKETKDIATKGKYKYKEYKDTVEKYFKL